MASIAPDAPTPDTRSAPRTQTQTSAPVFGKARIVRTLYEGRDIMPLWSELLIRVQADHDDAGAFYDLSIIMNSVGQKSEAAIAQRAAIRRAKTFRVTSGDGSGATILVLLTEGDLMANTPIEFLLEESDNTILLHFIDAATPDLGDVPDHDVAFVAVAESTKNLPVLRNLDRLLQGWRGPIMNNATRSIEALSRDGVSRTFHDGKAVVTPVISRLPRAVLQAIAKGAVGFDAIQGVDGYPFIVRPLDTHAGNGMEKIADAAQLGAFLEIHREPVLYVAPFIDYSSDDGKFRKQRIAFIDGRAYASHMAVSEHWMVHYLNAGMSQHEDRRVEEATWMATFDEDFAVRHAAAFAELCERVTLDYFAIDCAEMPDGRLLVFEVDVAMIVHAMDSAELFPYKKKAMMKLFKAFEAAIEHRLPALA